MTKLEGRILYPNCSEYISRLGIKKSEMPYIKKRVKELISDKSNQENLLEHFTELLGKDDETGQEMISEGLVAETYVKISEELLAKRNKVCPFCKETSKDYSKHIKDNHREELKSDLRDIDEEEYHKLKRELNMKEL